MTDIAIATVADLYEDDGGVPVSLELPKIEDVKANANKLSLDTVRQGMTVLINSFSLEAFLPAFAVPDMKKTFGLPGVVHATDKVNLLLECVLRRL